LGYKAFSTSRIYRQPRHLNLASEVPNKQPRSTFPSVRYVGPVLVGAAISTTSFITAAYIFDRNQQSLWEPLLARSREWSLFGTTEESLLAELWREKRILMVEKQKAMLDKLANTLDSMSLPIDVKRAVWMVGEKLSSMTESEKTLAGLIALNTLVFGCWQVPRLAPFMSKWFLHLPGSTRNITLLTSCFSHQEFFHFALNMVGLWSFGRIAHEHLGREQFVAMYLSVGVGANVVSHICSLALRHSRPLLPSLGASGAIYGLLASTAVLYPHSSISLIFLPMFPIKLG
jgi:rhomboid-like protein